MFAEGRLPRIGNEKFQLGARIGIDTRPDNDGFISDLSKGMSVSPSVEDLHPNIQPMWLNSRFPDANGPIALKIFRYKDLEFKTQVLNTDLKLEVNRNHGNICPAKQCKYTYYVSAISQTQPEWLIEDEE